MVKYVEGGIHKRLDPLIESIGGYDYKYHAKKIAKDMNLPEEGVIKIMQLSMNSNQSKANFLFNKYLREYQDGTPISKIEQEEMDRIKRITDNILEDSPAQCSTNK